LKLPNILLCDLITSVPSKIENVIFRIEVKISRLAKFIYDINILEYLLLKSTYECIIV